MSHIYIYIYIYIYGAPILDVSKSHSDAPQSVGLLWTSDQLVAETSTWQHTTLTTDKYPCPPLDSNPRSQQKSGHRPLAVVGDKRHALAASPPRKRPGTHCIGDWVGLWAGLENIAPTSARQARRGPRDNTKYKVTRKVIKSLRGVIRKLLIILKIWQWKCID